MKIFHLKIVIYVWVLSAITFYSCCSISNENYGIIQSEIKFNSSGSPFYTCMNLPDTACIRDSIQYQQIFKITRNDSVCLKIQLPIVDFKKNSVLLNHKSGNNRISFHRSVLVDSLTKTVTYLVAEESCPNHSLVAYSTDSYNIVLVPRISDDYLVKFK
jgi:hypothetical protein